jgi:HEPN domain-containing protein
MKPLTTEWIIKAEGDFHTMQREFQAQECPNYDGICFHAQQCAEKYLKARLCEADIRFGKIHDLVAILDLVLDIEPQWERYRQDLAFLSGFSVSFRYPGDSADLQSACDAKQRCDRFREAARYALGLK